LHLINGAVLPVAHGLKIFDASQGCSLLERILTSTVSVEVLVQFGLAVIDAWSTMYR